MKLNPTAGETPDLFRAYVLLHCCGMLEEVFTKMLRDYYAVIYINHPVGII
jgi:hypothetical protein